MNRITAAVAATSAVAALVLGGLLLTPTSAQAAGAPPQAFPDCGESTPVGGWDIRDLSATGTNVTDPAPVRPRSIRLSEPCWDDFDGALNVPVLTIPYRISDVPVPMLDLNDDGKDDGDGLVEGQGPTVEYLGGTVTYRGFLMDDSIRVNCFKKGGQVTTGALWAVVGGVRYQLTTGALTQDKCVSEFGGVRGDWVFTRIGNSTLAPDYYGFGGGTPFVWFATSNDVPGVGTDYYGGTQAARFAVGAGPTLAPESTSILCSDSYDGSAPTRHALSSTNTPEVGYHVPAVEEGEATSWSALGARFFMDVEEGFCPYLVSIELWYCAWVAHGPDDYACTEVTWSADAWRDHVSYGDDTTPEEYLCSIYPDRPECIEVIFPPWVDGTDFSAVCPESSFPSFDGLNSEWLRAWIGRFAECLFVPVNGWDAEGKIARAWESSAPGQIGALVGQFFESFSYSPGCGQLVDDSDGTTGLAMNTCDWNSWAPIVRSVAWWLVLVGYMMWALSFVFDTALSIPNKKTPNPVKGGKE